MKKIKGAAAVATTTSVGNFFGAHSLVRRVIVQKILLMVEWALVTRTMLNCDDSILYGINAQAARP